MVYYIHFIKFLSLNFVFLAKLMKVHSDLVLKLNIYDGSGLLFIAFAVRPTAQMQEPNFFYNGIDFRLAWPHINFIENIFCMGLNFQICSLFSFIFFGIKIIVGLFYGIINYIMCSFTLRTVSQSATCLHLC